MMLATTHNEIQWKVDYLQLAAILCLMVISVLFVASATTVNDAGSTLAWYKQTYFKQVIWFIMGLGAAGFICLIDYHVLTRWAVVGYVIAIFFLIAVLVPHIGTKINGARRWISMAGFQFQPSEFAKLALILQMAHYLSRPVDELRQPHIFWKSIGMMVLPFLLIMKEPDLGSALVLIPTGFAMLYAAGTPRRYLVKLFLVAGIVGAVFIGDIVFAPPKYRIIHLQEYQMKRLLVYFGRNYADYAGQDVPAAERKHLRELEANDRYNVQQALIAVGSGGLFGKGWRQGQQNALGFLPKLGKHNDFIFSVIAEEKGFIGSVTVLALYSVILFTGIRIAGQARDRLGKLMAVGVVALIFSHVFINIGMNIRIMPVTGVPLPLLSYGGSSVVFSLIAMGLLQNIYMYRKAY